MSVNYKISVIGLGYVGLPTALAIAESEYEVFGFDKNKEIIDELNSKNTRISEKGFKSFFDNVIDKKKISFYTELKKADIYIIAVPTPIYDNKEPNLEYVYDAFSSILTILEKNNSIILESTCPVGTTESLLEQAKSKRKDLFSEDEKPLFKIAYCPERVLPGNLVNEIINNDRIIGGINNDSSEFISNFYNTFTKGNTLLTNSNVAELVKLSENSYRDVNIAFANEISMICSEKDIDVNEVISLANKHPRVNILNPGIGVGGHCIPIDPWFIIHNSKEHSQIIRKARSVNDYKTEWIKEKIENIIKEKFGNTYGTKIGFLGVTYKPDVNDTRESPAIKIIDDLKTRYSFIKIADPYVSPKPTRFDFVSEEILLEDCDIIFILTKHKHYNNIKNKKIIDLS